MSSSSSDIQRAYDRWAAVYDTNRNPTRDLSACSLRQQAIALAGRAVLELGCGTGLNTPWLAERAGRVVAVDISDGMLGEARRRVRPDNVRFLVSDLTRPWPFGNGSFDLIVGNLVLEHIRDLGHVFAEGWRVLRPEGQLYLAELHPCKQLAGSQARYHDAQLQQEVLVPAFAHTTAEFVDEATKAGFTLRQMAEPRGAGEAIPRLLVLLFGRSGDVSDR